MPLRKETLTDKKSQAQPRDVQTFRQQFGQLECSPPLRRPATEPAVLAIIADERGRLWVEANGASGRQLMIIDLAQASVESAAMPVRDYGVVPVARGNRILFVSRDTAGNAVISMYSRRY